MSKKTGEQIVFLSSTFSMMSVMGGVPYPWLNDSYGIQIDVLVQNDIFR